MQRNEKNNIGVYLDLGLQFAVAVAIGVGAGYWADEKLGVFPLFLVLGLLLGATAGFLNIYRTVFPTSGMKKEKNKTFDEK